MFGVGNYLGKLSQVYDISSRNCPGSEISRDKPSGEGNQCAEIVRENVGISVQDYKSLRAAVMIHATLVNTRTHRQLLTSSTISTVS